MARIVEVFPKADNDLAGIATSTGAAVADVLNGRYVHLNPESARYPLSGRYETWRMLFTHKRMLQWNPSGDSDRSSRTDLIGSYRAMWAGPFIAAAGLIALS